MMLIKSSIKCDFIIDIMQSESKYTVYSIQCTAVQNKHTVSTVLMVVVVGSNSNKEI